MSNLRIRKTICSLVLLAAVAGYTSVANVESLNSGKLNVEPSFNGDNGILTADGGDPYPRPPKPPAVAF